MDWGGEQEKKKKKTDVSFDGFKMTFYSSLVGKQAEKLTLFTKRS